MQKDVICRFNTLWPKTNETLIIQKTENIQVNPKYAKVKELVTTFIFQAVKIDDLGKVTKKSYWI